MGIDIRRSYFKTDIKLFDLNTEENGEKNIVIAFSSPAGMQTRIINEKNDNFEKLLELGYKLSKLNEENDKRGRHEKLGEIKKLILKGSTRSSDIETWIKLFEKSFSRMSGREVTVDTENKKITIDGETLEPVITRHITRMINEMATNLGSDTTKISAHQRTQVFRHWNSLNLFIKKLYGKDTPKDVKRQLFAWLNAMDGGFTICENGNIVGYKGCMSPKLVDNQIVAMSINYGHGFVDGVEYTDSQLPNYVGATVTMPRDEVEHNPSVGCSRGLHVGTWEYAEAFSDGSLLVVEVDPGDVISVPYETSRQKLRCSKYKVIALRCRVKDLSSIADDLEFEKNEFVYRFDQNQEWIDPEQILINYGIKGFEEKINEREESNRKQKMKDFSDWGSDTPEFEDFATYKKDLWDDLDDPDYDDDEPYYTEFDEEDIDDETVYEDRFDFDDEDE